MTDEPPFDLILLDRYLAGDASPADRERVEVWLQSHPGTAQLLRELPRAATGDAQHAQTDASWQSLSARIRAAGSGDDLSERRAQVVAAAHMRRPAPWLRRASAVAAVLLLMVGGVATWRATRGGSLDAPRGRDVTATLPDGSRLTLSAGSRATWSSSFGKKSRDITLQGQALFDVVHDATRPFRVHTRDAVAEDIGTRFVVRAWPELASVEVAVEEGLVALSDSLHPRTDSTTVLHAGQLGRLDATGQVVVTTDADVALALTRGELVFDNRLLTEVLPAISRRFDVDIRADGALAERRLSARFAAQSLDEVLNALALSLDVRLARSGRSITLTPASR
jgi:transmembrane sensor